MLRNQIKCYANLNHWVVNLIYFGPQVQGINYVMCPPQEISDNDCDKTAFDLKTFRNIFLYVKYEAIKTIPSSSTLSKFQFIKTAITNQ